MLNDLAEAYRRAGDYVAAQRTLNKVLRLAAQAHDTLELHGAAPAPSAATRPRGKK